MEGRSPIRAGSLVVFDGDDTLWWTEPLYDAARAQAAELVGLTGLDPVIWDRLEREIDVRNVSILGLSRDRFPTSCLEAYEQLARSRGALMDPRVVEKITEIASSVFTKSAPVVEGAAGVLEALSSSATLALLTRGDATVQSNRIAQSGLERLFSFVEIVPQKSPNHFQDLLRRSCSDPAASWSIGNSRRSDIDPALAIGMQGICIEAHVWEYERVGCGESHPRLHTAVKLIEVPEIVLRECRPVRVE